MKGFLSYCCFVSVIALTACLAACDSSPADKVAIASRLVKERPDSAYAILRDVDYGELDADSLKAEYVVTKAMANISVSRSLITDTLLDTAAEYYISVGDTAKWVIASQLQSGHDLMKGDSESALRRLEDMATRIGDAGLLWDNHIHMLEMALYSHNYASAYNYADWLSRHTDVPEDILRFGMAKGVAQYQQGNFTKALDVADSIIAAGVVEKARPEVSMDFYSDYAELLDGAGHPREAIAVIDSLCRNGGPVGEVEKIARIFALAQFHANAGDSAKAWELLEMINQDATQSVFEVYASVAMLKAALQFKESGRFPSEVMHEVTKTMQRDYHFEQLNCQTAMESVMELREDNYRLKLQRQRLWLLVSVTTLLSLVCVVVVYFVMSRRKRRMIDAEERAETLERMLKDTENAEDGMAVMSDRDKLKAALLRQLGIFKTFAGTPTQQSRDALRKISAAGGGGTIESLVDWHEFHSMIDNLYDGFHAKLVEMYPGLFNDKEQQIIVLLKAGFSTKEIGVLTEQSSATIYTRKSVIRKKLATPEDGDFIAQLEGLFRSV